MNFTSFPWTTACLPLSLAGLLAACGSAGPEPAEPTNPAVASAPNAATAPAQPVAPAAPTEPAVAAPAEPEHDLLEGHVDACNDRDAEGCRLAGIDHETGFGERKPNRRLSLGFLSRGCKLGSTASCGRLGAAYVDAPRSRAEARRGMRLLAVACDDDDGRSCTVLGRVYWRGGPVQPDIKTAQTYLSRACTLGHDAGCTLVETIEASPVQGWGLERRCSLGKDPGACEVLSLYMSDHDPRIEKVLSGACKNGRGKAGACLELGTRWLARTDMPRDVERGRKLLDKLCTNGEAPVCLTLASHYLEGQPDSDRAKRGIALLEKGCTLGDAYACNEHGFVYLDGIPSAGVKPDPTRALGKFTRACELDSKHAVACMERDRLGRGK